MLLDQAKAAIHPRPIPSTSRVFYLWQIDRDELRWGGHSQWLFGLRAEQMPASMAALLGYIHDEDLSWVEARFRAFLADTQPLRIECRVRSIEQQVIPISAHAAFVDTSTVTGSIARLVIPDAWEPPLPATEDEELSPGRPYHHNLDRFFDLSADLLCIAGTDGYFKRVNPNFTKVLGYSTTELLSRPFLDYVHPEDRTATLAAVERLTMGLPVVYFPNRYRDARGGYRWLEWAARSIPSEGVIFAVARDVTERVELEQKLRTQEARERAILDNTTSIIAVKDREGRYEFVNEQFSRIFAMDRHVVLGKTDQELFVSAVADTLCSNDRNVFDSGATIQVETVVPYPDGPHRFISVKFPLYDTQGQALSVASIATDITDRLRAQDAEDQLRTARHVQQKLYPQRSPTLPGFDIASHALSASHLCGDYFDFVRRHDGRLVAAIGDVCGHGLGPALTMVETRAAIRLLTQSQGNLATIMSLLNQQLYHETGESLFVTLFLAELDPSSRSVSFAGAGHEGVLVRATGAVERLPSTGPLLGILDQPSYESVPLKMLDQGDVLVLFTDGLPEAMNITGTQFGTERTYQILSDYRQASAQQIIDRLFTEILSHVAGQPIKDDMTMIVVKAL